MLCCASCEVFTRLDRFDRFEFFAKLDFVVRGASGVRAGALLQQFALGAPV